MTAADVRADTLIEQAIARGHTASRIAHDLHVDLDHVHHIWDQLDALDDDIAVPVLNPTMARPRAASEPVAPFQMPTAITRLPTYWQGRPIETYFGPAAPEVIERLVDAVCPPRSARRLRKGWVAA